MSQYLVSARKYRPTRFDELVGQSHVANTLKNAILNDQLAHAFLFCGPRGVGKTSCARILAKVLNCQNLQNQFDPCGECSSCVSFNDNASFNIIELDAASNNSVEHIRNLTEQVRFQPQHGTHKVFIIDEVHMLSSQAFNAFLKTLEEPPPYAVFILATTEKHKILPTILSRCQIFDFKRIQVNQIVEQLKSISTKENITYDERALSIIGQKADGAMRDALSIFDKVVSSTDRQISYEELIEHLNILDYDYYFKLTEYFLSEDISNVMLLFDEILSKGFDPELCLLGLAEHFRELLLGKNPATQKLLIGNPELITRYSNQSKLCSQSMILSALSILNAADINFQKAKNKRLHAEISLSKLTFLNRRLDSTSAQTTTATKPAAVESAKNVETNTTAPPKPKVMVKSSSPSKTIHRTIKKIGFSTEEEILEQIEIEEEKQKVKPKKLDLELIKAIWDTYLENINSPTIGTSLRLKSIELQSNKILVHLPSPSALNTFVAETKLVNQIRNAFDIDMLKIEPMVNTVMFPDYEKFTPKKRLNPREKYEKLVEANPDLILLKRAFDLKVDS